MDKKDNGAPHFVTSHDFHGDAEYVAWLQEIKRRYQRIRSRIALQANYGTLEFNWLLGRDLKLHQPGAELQTRWVLPPIRALR